MMKITFLGTGTSHGVPTLDCMIENYSNCPKGVCLLGKNDPKHVRSRSSILVQWNDFTVLIDASADFRAQALREQIRKIDAVLITHSHADHIGGIPDIRSYTKNKPLSVYGSEECLTSLKKTYSYIFDPDTFVAGGIPNLSAITVKDPFNLHGKTIIPIKVSHGILKECLGYRIGPLTYIPDMKAIDEINLEKLKGTELLILNCLRTAPEHPTHLILPESMKLAEKIAPRICYFIHMCHDIHYEADSKNLKPWMGFSFDSLTLTI